MCSRENIRNRPSYCCAMIEENWEAVARTGYKDLRGRPGSLTRANQKRRLFRRAVWSVNGLKIRAGGRLFRRAVWSVNGLKIRAGQKTGYLGGLFVKKGHLRRAVTNTVATLKH